MLTDKVKILMISMLLEQSAAMWYKQIFNDYQVYLNNTILGYTGRFVSLDAFLKAFLEQFQDVDIQQTAITKI